MSVLVKGMEKPEHCGYCRFRYDGICHALQKTQYSMNECPLVVIDDAGLNDTISRQKAIERLEEHRKIFCNNHMEFIILSAKDKARVDEIDNCIATLINLPSVDAVPVVRRKDWFCAQSERKES